MIKIIKKTCDVCETTYNVRFESFTDFKGELCCESCLELKTDNYFKLGSEKDVINYIFRLLTAKGVPAVKDNNSILIEKKLPNGTILKYVLTLYCEFYDCATNIILSSVHNVKGLNKGFVVTNGRDYSVVKNDNYINALNNFKKACIKIGRDKVYRYENTFDITISEDKSSLDYKHKLNIDILNGDTKEIDYSILNTLIEKLSI